MSLKTFVSDELHSLVGYSDSTVADFIVATAKRSGSRDQLLSSLTGTGTLTNNG